MARYVDEVTGGRRAQPSPGDAASRVAASRKACCKNDLRPWAERRRSASPARNRYRLLISTRRAAPPVAAMGTVEGRYARRGAAASLPPPEGVKSRFDWPRILARGGGTVCFGMMAGEITVGGTAAGGMPGSRESSSASACVGGFSASLSTPLLGGCATRVESHATAGKAGRHDAPPGADDGEPPDRPTACRRLLAPIPGLVPAAQQRRRGIEAGLDDRDLSRRNATPGRMCRAIPVASRSNLGEAVEWRERPAARVARPSPSCSCHSRHHLCGFRVRRYWYCHVAGSRLRGRASGRSTTGGSFGAQQDLDHWEYRGLGGRSSATAAGSGTGACAAASRFARCGRRRFTISAGLADWWPDEPWRHCRAASRFRRCRKGRTCMPSRPSDRSALALTPRCFRTMTAARIDAGRSQ